MAKIINMGDSPVATMKARLEEAEASLIEERRKTAQLETANEMMKLQIHELLTTLRNMEGAVQTAIHNVQVIRDHLPKTSL